MEVAERLHDAKYSMAMVPVHNYKTNDCFQASVGIPPSVERLVPLPGQLKQQDRNVPHSLPQKHPPGLHNMDMQKTGATSQYLPPLSTVPMLKESQFQVHTQTSELLAQSETRKVLLQQGTENKAQNEHQVALSQNIETKV